MLESEFRFIFTSDFIKTWCFVNLLNLLEKMLCEKDKMISILKEYHDQVRKKNNKNT
jgi:hypothetical protein